MTDGVYISIMTIAVIVFIAGFVAFMNWLEPHMNKCFDLVEHKCTCGDDHLAHKDWNK